MNKKTRILIGTVLEVESRGRTFVVKKIDLGGGDMKVATINIRSFKLHTPEPPCPATGDDFGERDIADTMITTGDKIVTYPVSV